MGPVVRRNILLLAVFLALVTTMLVYVYLTRVTQQRVQEPEQVPVLAAARKLDVRTVVTEDMLTTAYAPSTQRPALFGPEEQVQVVDKVVVRPLEPGTLIRREDVMPKDPALWGLAFVVPKGMRAVTISIDRVSGVAGFLKPGDRVDVMATFNANNGTLTKSVLQNVLLLAVGAVSRPPTPQEGGKQPAGAPQESATATLAVSPFDAGKLILASGKGKIQLALRSVEDKLVVRAPPVTSRQVVGFVPPDYKPQPTTPPKPVRRLAPPIPTVRPMPGIMGGYPGLLPQPAREVPVYRGTQVEKVPAPL